MKKILRPFLYSSAVGFSIFPSSSAIALTPVHILTSINQQPD
jgi:hypothetical protein